MTVKGTIITVKFEYFTTEVEENKVSSGVTDFILTFVHQIDYESTTKKYQDKEFIRMKRLNCFPNKQ